MSEHLLRIRGVAERLDCSERTVRRLIATGELPAIDVRGSVRVHPDDLAEFEARHRRVVAPEQVNAAASMLRQGLARAAAQSDLREAS